MGKGLLPHMLEITVQTRKVVDPEIREQNRRKSDHGKNSRPVTGPSPGQPRMQKRGYTSQVISDHVSFGSQDQ